MSCKCSVTSDIDMALTTQVLVVCAIVGLSSANVIFNHHRHRPRNDLEDLPQLLTNMFHPRNPMEGLLQIQPINNPGILGFHSFGGQGLGDISSGMFGQGQGGYGTEDFMPVTSEPFDRDDGNSQDPLNDYGEQERDPIVGTDTSQDGPGDQFNNNNKEMEPNKHDDTDKSNKDQEPGKSNSAEKEGEDQKTVDLGTDSASVPNKTQSEDISVSKHRDKDAIIFPDKVDQAKDQIAKESSYYVSPQSSNGYVSSPGPQIIYATTYVPSGSSTSQVPYVPNTVQSNTPNQPTVSTVQSYPSTSNINVQNPQPQYQTNGNSPTGNVVLNSPTTNPGYTLVTVPNNGANSNSPVYYTNSAPVSNPPQNTNYQPLNTGQQYYMTTINGQNVLVPLNNGQTAPNPNQSNGNGQTNLIPINQGSYVPSNSQVNYVPVTNQNVPSSTPQNNGQVHYILVQLAPQNNPQNNNQAIYVPANQGTVQTPPQGGVNYVPMNSQPLQTTPQNNNQVTYVSGNPPNVVQAPPQNNNQVTYVSGNPPQAVQAPPPNNNQVTYVSGNPPQVVQAPPPNNNQVTYVSGNPPQVVQAPPQNNNQVTYVSGNPPQSNNQVHYVPVNPQMVQVGSNTPTNSGQITYVPWNPQNPQSTTQYKLVPINTENNGQSNLVRLVPATLTTNGNVSLLSFKEKAKLSSKSEKKHKE